MMKNIKWITVLLLAAVPHLHLPAEFTWHPVEGWQFEGDRSKAFIGDPEEFEHIRSLMNTAKEAHEEGKLRTAIKFYRRVWDRYPGSIFAPEALFQTAQVEYDRTAYRRAFNALTTIILGYPDYEQYSTVVRLQFSIATDLYQGKRARYLWGLVPGFKGYDRAIIMYETMVANAPYSEYAPMALMKAADLHLKLNNDIYAVDTLDRLINSYPDSMLTGDAYLLLAKTFAKLVDGPQYDQGATREAISYFEDFLILFPDHPKVKEGEDGLDQVRSIQAQSKMVKGDFYFYKWKDFRAAKVFYNEAITVAPNSPEAKIAQVQLAQVDERIQNRIEQYERENSLVPSSRREGLAEQLQREAGFIPSSDSEGVEDPTEF